MRTRQHVPARHGISGICMHLVASPGPLQHPTPRTRSICSLQEEYDDHNVDQHGCGGDSAHNGDGDESGPDDLTCAICLGQIQPLDLALIKGCEHQYCGELGLAAAIGTDPAAVESSCGRGSRRGWQGMHDSDYATQPGTFLGEKFPAHSYTSHTAVGSTLVSSCLHTSYLL